MARRRKKLSTKQIEYRRYLKSKKWAKKRAKVLKRFNYTCAKCGATTGPFNVHHLTYQHIYNEKYFELILLCENCHSAIHRNVYDERDKTIIKSLLTANRIDVKLVQFLLAQID